MAGIDIEGWSTMPSNYYLPLTAWNLLNSTYRHLSPVLWGPDLPLLNGSTMTTTINNRIDILSVSYALTIDHRPLHYVQGEGGEYSLTLTQSLTLGPWGSLTLRDVLHMYLYPNDCTGSINRPLTPSPYCGWVPTEIREYTFDGNFYKRYTVLNLPTPMPESTLSNLLILDTPLHLPRTLYKCKAYAPLGVLYYIVIEGNLTVYKCIAHIENEYLFSVLEDRELGIRLLPSQSVHLL